MIYSFLLCFNINDYYQIFSVENKEIELFFFYYYIKHKRFITVFSCLVFFNIKYFIDTHAIQFSFIWHCLNYKLFLEVCFFIFLFNMNNSYRVFSNKICVIDFFLSLFEGQVLLYGFLFSAFNNMNDSYPMFFIKNPEIEFFFSSH